MKSRPLFAALVLAVCTLHVGAEEKKFEPIEINGQLAETDPLDRKLNQPCKLHRFDFVAGKTYVLDLISKNFDAYLRLENPQGVQLAEDDDSGGNLNSRITYTATASGNYQLSATTLNGAVGPYLLRVRQIDPNREAKIKLGEILEVGPKGITIESRIDLTDPKSPVATNPPRRPTLCKVYSVKLKANQSYTIDLESAAFDAYLHLLDSTMKSSLAQDDDSGGGLNARIAGFRPQADGTYHIVATSLAGGEGAFILRVRADKE